MIDPPLGNLYDVGGRRLMLHRSGSGTPAVVIDAGAGNFGLDYLFVADGVAEFTSCVVYDRAGYGWSEPDPEPRTADRVTDDLRALLTVARVAGPLVLVGHSLGGFHVRRYAQRFPDEVAGLVLVEPSHEDMAAGMPEQLKELDARQRAAMEDLLGRPEIPAPQLAAFRAQVSQVYATWPDSVRHDLIDRHLDRDNLRAAVTESNAIEAVGEAVRNGGVLPQVPVIVLTGGAPDPLPIPADLITELLDRKRELHADLAESVAGGEHRVVKDAGHMIPYQRPDAVIQAVRDVVSAIRG